MKTVSLISTSARVSKVLVVALVLSIAFTGFARAEEAAANAPNLVTQKIAVVDLSLLISQSKAGKSIRDQIDAQRKSYGAQLEKKEKDFNKEGADLKAQQGKISKEEFVKKYNAYIQKAKAAELEVRKRRDSFEKAYVTALEKIREHIVKIVAAISTEKGIALVLNRQEVVLVDTKMDITQEVLKELDAKVSSIPVTVK